MVAGGPRPCRYCSKPVVFLPVEQRGGKPWPFEPALIDRPQDPAAEQWTHQRGRGVVDGSLMKIPPAKVLERHHCREYAEAVTALRAKETQDRTWHWARPDRVSVYEGDPEVRLIAGQILRPRPELGFTDLQLLAMVARTEVAAPRPLTKHVAFDLPIEVAVHGFRITKVLWALVYDGQIYRPVAGSVLALTAYGETRLRETAEKIAAGEIPVPWWYMGVDYGPPVSNPVPRETWQKAGLEYRPVQAPRISLAQARQVITELQNGEDS